MNAGRRFTKGRGAFSRTRRSRRSDSGVGDRNKEAHPAPLLTVTEADERQVRDHPENMATGLEVLWRQGALCDVTLSVDGNHLRAHRAVLATCSDYFHDVLVTRPEELSTDVDVAVEGIKAATAHAIIECMYTGKITLNETNVRDILTAANYFKYNAVEEACGSYLKERLNQENCLRMLCLAHTYNLRDLETAAMEEAAHNFPTVARGYDFLQLDVDLLQRLLGSNSLAVDSELDVFTRAVAWLQEDLPQRRQHAGDVLSQVRLPLLTPSQIVDNVETTKFLMEIPACQQVVKEALHYHVLPQRQSVLQSPRTVPRCSQRREVLVTVGGAPRLKTDAISDSVCCLDPASQQWNLLTMLPDQPRHHHAVATLGGFLYVAGGESNNDQRSPVASVVRYDPRTDQWLAVASLRHPRESFQMVALHDKLYAIGGRVDKDLSLDSVEMYRPEVDQWEEVAPLSSPRRSVAVAAMGGRIYAMGGSANKRISGRVERYNPLSNQWEIRRSLLKPRFFSVLAPVNNRLYLIGGATMDEAGNVVCSPSVDVYIPATDTWSVVMPMLDPRAEAGAAVVGTKIYVVGGYSWDKATRLSSVECFDTDKHTWSLVAGIDQPLTGIGCAALTVYDTFEKKSNEKKAGSASTLKGYRTVCTSAVTHTPAFVARSETALMPFSHSGPVGHPGGQTDIAQGDEASDEEKIGIAWLTLAEN